MVIFSYYLCYVNLFWISLNNFNIFEWWYRWNRNFTLANKINCVLNVYFTEKNSVRNLIKHKFFMKQFYDKSNNNMYLFKVHR